MTVANVSTASTLDQSAAYVYTGGTGCRQAAMAPQSGAYRELHGGGAGLVIAFVPEWAIFEHVGDGNWLNAAPIDRPNTGPIALTTEGRYVVLGARVRRNNGFAAGSWTQIGLDAPTSMVAAGSHRHRSYDRFTDPLPRGPA